MVYRIGIPVLRSLPSSTLSETVARFHSGVSNTVKVFRAVGESYQSRQDDAWLYGFDARALFVTDSEEGAIAWALQLWHVAPKHAIECLEVRGIRDVHLNTISDFVEKGFLCEFIPAGDGGFDTVYHNFVLREAVILQEDIVG